MNKNAGVIMVVVIIVVVVGGIMVYRNSGREGAIQEDARMMEVDNDNVVPRAEDDEIEEENDDVVVTPAPAPVNPSPTPAATQPTPAPVTPTAKTFTVTGENFSFVPASLRVKKGDTVIITFKNISGFHDFVIDEFKIATKQITGGKEETVTFVADKTGSYEYYCSVGEHRAMGMKGTLVVE